ncbi:MAG: hypothetical protein IKS24_04690, partial [Bacteroidaceae bacterium]|nr:hypothetical protein [Bacteroidaceae bacterium]
DAVKYDGVWYVARIDAGEITGAWNANKWNTFGAQFESVATGLLLAENANIAGWIFKNNRLESQAKSNGGEPMAYLNGLLGEMRLKGTIQMSTGYSGNISDVNLFFLPERNSLTYLSMGYELSDIGKVVRLYNSGAYGKGDYKIQCSDFTIVTSSGGSSTTVNSSFFARCRPQEIIELSCFERSTSSGKRGVWTITGRFGPENFVNKDQKGRFPTMIAMGTISLDSSSASISGKMYDGRSLSDVMSVTKSGNAALVSFTSGTLPTNYRLFLTERDCHASAYDVTNTGFKVKFLQYQNYTAGRYDDYDSYIDVSFIGLKTSTGTVNFMILDNDWSYPMT